MQATVPSYGIDIYATSSVTVQGGSVIENNPDSVGIYITGSGASLMLNRGPGTACPLIQNNAEGVYADTNASVAIRQCTIIRNNSDIGVMGLSGEGAGWFVWSRRAEADRP